jgi:hypothetical protein
MFSLDFSRSPLKEMLQSAVFCYVDFHLYYPILDTLEFVNERMRKDRRIVVDNYGMRFFAAHRKAVDDFVPGSDFDILISDYNRFAILIKR